MNWPYPMDLGALYDLSHDAHTDLAELTSASPVLQAAAVQQGRLLVDSDPDARKDWETHVARIWLDLAPWIARGQALRLESLRRKAG